MNQWIFCCAFFLFVFSCQDDEGTPTALSTEKLNAIQSSISNIEALIEQDVLLLNFEENDERYTFNFEKGIQETLDKELVKSIDDDDNLDQWVFRIIYCDNNILNIPYLSSLFDVSSEDIELDPYGISPLAARATFQTKVNTKVRVTVLGKGDDGIPISKVQDNFGRSQTFSIYGLYPDHENLLQFDFLNKDDEFRSSVTISLSTEELSQAPVIEVLQNDFTEQEKTEKLFLIAQPPMVIDSHGEIRWALDPSKWRAYPTKDGDVFIQLTGDRQAWDGQGELIGMLGQRKKVYEFPKGVHHEMHQIMENGNFLIGANVGGTEPENSFLDDDTEDLIQEININTGQVVKEWDMRQIFDFDRQRFWTELQNDWFHLNSIQYDPTDNTLLISSRHQAFVGKIGYDDNEIKWILGTHERWGDSHQQYLLDPTNFDVSMHPEQDWPYGQHSPRMTQEGDVLMYDNGMDRPGFDADESFNKDGGYVRAVIYSVDELNKTVTKKWEHVPFGTEVFSKAVGSVSQRSDGNVVQGHGILNLPRRVILEVDTDGELIFEANYINFQDFYRVYAFSF